MFGSYAAKVATAAIRTSLSYSFGLNVYLGPIPGQFGWVIFYHSLQGVIKEPLERGGWRTLDLLILILQSFHTLSHIQLKTKTMHMPPEYVGIFLERTILDYKLVEVPKYTLILETISYPPSFEIIQNLYPLPITFSL